MQIHQDNWTTARFQGPETLAFIALGAKPSKSGEAELVWSLTVTDLEYQEIFQQSYSSLELALEQINKKYSHWTLTDAGLKIRDGDGCSSCHAH